MSTVVKVSQLGAQLVVHFDDGTKKIAYPSQGGLWYVGSGAPITPPPPPPPSGGGTNVVVPNSLTANMKDGTSVTLNKQQLTWASIIITVSMQNGAIGKDGAIIALMAALTESGLRMYSNSGAVPSSVNYPHDADGSDHDSLGLFQMRPSAGWGTVAELMDGTYNAQAFYGGPSGPNHGSPRGLLDINGWQTMDKGNAAQAVEVSAFPDRYQNYQPVAEAIYAAEVVPGSGGAPGAGHSTVIYPTKQHTVVDFDGSFIGHKSRTPPSVNPGSDYAPLSVGNDVWAVADGVVTDVTNTYGGSGGRMVHIDHAALGTSSDYLHLSQPLVSVGQAVKQGDLIAKSGASGFGSLNYYGPHLHISYRNALGHAYTNFNSIDFDAYIKGLGIY